MSPVERADGTREGGNLQIDNVSRPFLGDGPAEVMVMAAMHLDCKVLLVYMRVQRAERHQHQAEVREQAQHEQGPVHVPQSSGRPIHAPAFFSRVSLRARRPCS